MIRPFAALISMQLTLQGCAAPPSGSTCIVDRGADTNIAHPLCQEVFEQMQAADLGQAATLRIHSTEPFVIEWSLTYTDLQNQKRSIARSRLSQKDRSLDESQAPLLAGMIVRLLERETR